MNRLLIYYFYDKSGIIDDYVYYMLENIRLHVSKIIFISNGILSAESNEKLKKYSDTILNMENTNCNIYGYYEAIKQFGINNMAEYDEVVFMDYNLMYALSSFKDMFSAMENRQVDFWGITKGYEEHNYEYGVFINEHIKFNFIVFKNSLIKNGEFIKYWDNLESINIYNDYINSFEFSFTKYFNDLGFKSDVYINNESLNKYIPNPLLYAPYKLVKDYKCPVFDRRSFFLDYYNYLDYSNGEDAYKLISYLEKENYNIDFIWDNILRTANQYDIKNALHLNYIVPSNVLYENKHEKVKVALMMHIYFEDLADYCADYASHMPGYADIYITTNTESKKAVIEKSFSKLSNKVLVLVIENRGRDVSSLLVALREYVYKYDLVCFVHDKKVAQLFHSIKGETFSNQCFDNLLKSKDFVSNVITLFHDNKRLGMLVPPPPQFADYYPSVSGFGWGKNYENSIKFFQKYNINVDIDYDKEATAPYGTMFWFRSKALLKLLDINLKYEDFEAEPANTDGVLMHAIERAYAIVCQEAGYYPAWLLSDEFAKIEVTNLQYMLTRNNREIFKMIGNNLFSVTNRGIMQQYNGMQNEISALKEVVSILKESVKNHEQHIDILKESVKNHEQHIDMLTNSFSWKITRPLRGVRKLFKMILGKK